MTFKPEPFEHAAEEYAYGPLAFEPEASDPYEYESGAPAPLDYRFVSDYSVSDYSDFHVVEWSKACTHWAHASYLVGYILSAWFGLMFLLVRPLSKGSGWMKIKLKPDDLEDFEDEFNEAIELIEEVIIGEE